ncbi:hypothetical protein K466DRAFT_126003 [Polyporus arcularius HHB13444]|uniref:Uncharacterized protein n=1 Tax=Polyporus arcularius HHB13444 TaxID=1314778 RepID=A0A5C3PEX7_9APHY|nr:hypothetical protein K466DRAFT_126003 [Polyporus arcularius HHB13444]
MPVSKTTIASHPVAADFVCAGSLSESATGYAGTITAVRWNVGGGSETVDWAAVQQKTKVLTVYGDEDIIVLCANIPGFMNGSLVKVLGLVGHTPTVEAAEETAQAAAEFDRS